MYLTDVEQMLQRQISSPPSTLPHPLHPSPRRARAPPCSVRLPGLGSHPGQSLRTEVVQRRLADQRAGWRCRWRWWAEPEC